MQLKLTVALAAVGGEREGMGKGKMGREGEGREGGEREREMKGKVGRGGQKRVRWRGGEGEEREKGGSKNSHYCSVHCC